MKIIFKYPLFLVILFISVLIFGAYLFISEFKFNSDLTREITDNPQMNLESEGGLEEGDYPLSIEFLRKLDFPGSEIKIEQILAPTSSYKKYVASYKSQGLTIYGLLTIPSVVTPSDGFPVVIFNHGYIPPREYKTTERYVSYVDAFARSGYVVFKPDYRGHGDSEGEASGAYGSNAYTIDVLNAISSLKKLKNPLNADDQKLLINPDRIGMWGHSMGGFITLRSMVVERELKAGVIWAGVVGSYSDLLNNWRRRSLSPSPGIPSGARRWRQELVERFGTPESNPKFWDSISSTSYLSDISGPLQLHHGTADASVPIEFSKKLADKMKALGEEVEIYIYESDDHNLSGNLSLALRRSVEFFDKYLK